MFILWKNVYWDQKWKSRVNAKEKKKQRKNQWTATWPWLGCSNGNLKIYKYQIENISISNFNPASNWSKIFFEHRHSFSMFVIRISKFVHRSLVRGRHDAKSFVLLDSEVEEMHVKGSGPGGSKQATTCSCVILKHLPTGNCTVLNHNQNIYNNFNYENMPGSTSFAVQFRGSSKFMITYFCEIDIKVVIFPICLF